MTPADRDTRRVRRTFLLALAAATSLSALGAPAPSGETSAKKPAPPAAGAVEVRLTDDSTLKLTLREERIEVATRFGKLSIPVGDVNKIEFGLRIPEGVGKRIQAAVADLGSSDFKKREAASAELLALKELAYPALLAASKDKDAEVARRAEEVLAKVREAVPEEKLDVRADDVIYTSDDSKIVGRIVASSFRVSTAQFGELQLKLTHVRSLHAQGYVDQEAAAGEVEADPGTMNAFQGMVGKTIAFRVTGGQAGGRMAAAVMGGGPFGPAMAFGGTVWGSDPYTLDSMLGLAAVHAGVLKQGQTGVVRVKILGPLPAFQGSTKNGVTSQPWGPYPGGFTFVKKKG
jgi:hypothetical protein